MNLLFTVLSDKCVTRREEPKLQCTVGPALQYHYELVHKAEMGGKKIFSKFDPGAVSQMPEDQFGPKKPSISPYNFFEISCQTCGRQENQVIFSEKTLLAIWLIAHTRDHIFQTSWCHMKAMTCGYMAKVKKIDF